jgi:tocopherol O-methyltransferase
MLAREMGAHVTGLTLSVVQHEHAARAAEGDPRLRFFVRDWLDNELPDEQFDAVLAIESTEHMDDKASFFSESARVLRPGGRLVVCAWLAAEAPRPWERTYLLEPICQEGRLPSLGTAAEYNEWIAAAGLTPESFEDITQLVKRTWTLSTARLARRIFTHPSSWTWLMNRANTDRVFVRTVGRILVAYRVGCMRYGIFTARR